MSCQHGNWSGCDLCEEINTHEKAYALLFKENSKRRSDNEALTAAARELLHQIDIGDFTDPLGHKAVKLMAVHTLRAALAAAEGKGT